MPMYGTTQHKVLARDLATLYPGVIHKGEFVEFAVAVAKAFFTWYPEGNDDPDERIRERKRIKLEWLLKDIVWQAAGRWTDEPPKVDWRSLLKCKTWAEWDRAMAPMRTVPALGQPCAVAYSKYAMLPYEEPGYKELSLMNKARLWRARAEALQKVNRETRTTVPQEPTPAQPPQPSSTRYRDRSPNRSRPSTSSAATRIRKRKPEGPSASASSTTAAIPKGNRKIFRALLTDSDSDGPVPPPKAKRVKRARKMSGVEVEAFDSDGKPAGFVETWDTE